MSHHLSTSDLATLLVRLTALVIIIFALCDLLMTGVFTLFDIFGHADFQIGFGTIGRLLSPASMFLVAMLVYIKSVPIASLLTRGLHPPGHCQRCGYNLAAIGKTRCPECGHDEAPAQPTDNPT